LLFGLVMGAVAIGSIAVPPLIASIGIRTTLLVVGAFLPLVTVISLRRLLAIDRRAPVHTDEVALLRSVPMFGSLSVAASEDLALLRHIPRQATVKATEDSSVYAFEGKDFIAAVTGHCLSDRTAQELVEARLSENIRADQTAGGEVEP